MDQIALVNVEAAKLRDIATAFRQTGLRISGVYLIQLTAESGFSDWIVRLVMNDESRDALREMIHQLVRLRRENRIPELMFEARFDLIDGQNEEARRIFDYARQVRELPVLIKDTMWKGLFIEYAIVAEVPQSVPVLA